MPRMDEKKFHIPDFQRKGSSGNIWCKLLQKRITRKTAECSKHLRHIAIEKYILSDLNRCIFQISLKYIKLVILKILFILVLCSFSFYFKITWPPQQSYPPPSKDFSEIFNPPPAPPPPSWRGEVHALKSSPVICLFKFLTDKPFSECSFGAKFELKNDQF